jgi:hypothetical protein
MSERTDTITQVVIAAIANATGEQSAAVGCASETLRRMDSLALLMACAQIQEALGRKFAPEQLMQLFLSQSIADMVAVIEMTLV